jgi:hypothetical protein
MAIISGVVGTAAFAKWDQHVLWAGMLSILVAVLAALMTFLNPNERSNTHLRCGNSYDSLRGQARIFWTIDVHQESSDAVLTSRLKDIAEQRDKLNHSSPQFPFWAYFMAKKGILAGEADFEVDKTGDRV